jgi:hypothetical protein
MYLEEISGHHSTSTHLFLNKIFLPVEKLDISYYDRLVISLLNVRCFSKKSRSMFIIVSSKKISMLLRRSSIFKSCMS